MLGLQDQSVTVVLVGDKVPTHAYQGDELVWELPPVTLTIEGISFSPQLELAAGSTAAISWIDETDTVVGSGAEPSITWGDAGPHTLRIYVSQPMDVETFNIGYHEMQDNGLYSLPSSYRRMTQPVTNINNLQYFTGLRRFMAARTDGISDDYTTYNGPLLSGHVNLTGMTNLEYVECFRANIQSIAMIGCSSIMRICLEGCQLTSLDLNPMRQSLLDLRAAVMQGGVLTLEPMEGPLENVYHFCTRRQNLIGFPGAVNLPAIRQLWVWQNSLDEDELVIRSNANLHSLLLSTNDDYGVGSVNQIRSLDLAGQTWGSLDGPLRIEANSIGLEEVNFTDMAPISRLEFENNNLSTAMIDHILLTVDSWGTSGVHLFLEGNEAPTASGAAAAENLRARGWTVSHEVVRTLLWSDEFDRANATGFASSGGWYPGLGHTDTDVAIAGGALVLSGTNSYRTFLHPAGGNLPADVEVEIGFTIVNPSEPGAYWGVVNRWFNNQGPGVIGDGIKLLFRGDKLSARVGLARDASDGGTFDVTGLVPSGWNDVGQHTVSLKSVGAQHYVLCDGVQVISYDRNYYANPGGAVGFCGEPQGRAWDYIRVYAA